MKLDIVQIGLGIIGGYWLATKMKDDKKEIETEATKAALGAIQLGALHTNPYGAIQMNPAHYGAIQMNPAHLGALQMNPHGTLARSFEGAHGAKSPAGYGAIQMNPAHLGALHLGALAQEG